jgi:hypothetical protein
VKGWSVLRGAVFVGRRAGVREGERDRRVADLDEAAGRHQVEAAVEDGAGSGVTPSEAAVIPQAISYGLRGWAELAAQ